ncbi:hypothetical protein [Cohnella caldifontis]|uniref:hypothetical protein n=1 Tax=Cohnella caldifontis TaxID=3027471 RepID=UPI0023EA91EC|nr:hypothetical protein [Cohnella sp. YIM B05605]
MKFWKKKPFLIMMMVAAMLCSSLGSAYAAANLDPIKAFFNKGVSFVLNGERWQPKDASGKTLNAIYYNGTNYLPARAIAEALKIPIDFDATNQIIYIGGKPGEKTPIFGMPMEIDNIYAVLTKNPAETLVKDTQYKEVLKIDQYGDAVFTLDRKFKRLVLYAAVVDPGEHDVEFTSYNASELAGNMADVALETHTVSPDDPVTEMVFNVEGLDKVRIHVQSHNLNPYIYARILDTSFFDNGETPSR